MYFCFFLYTYIYICRHKIFNPNLKKYVFYISNLLFISQTFYRYRLSLKIAAFNVILAEKLLFPI